MISAVYCREKNTSPKAQIFLLFDDDTYFEIYSSDHLSATNGVDKGDLKEVINLYPQEEVRSAIFCAPNKGGIIEFLKSLFSGKLRAEQTAQILAEYLKPSGGLISVSGLAPNDDVVPVGRIAANELANSMLVGHLPFLSRLAGLLVTGNPEVKVVRFCNAGIVCLINEKGSWSINWVTRPELLV